jgi:hypothetical protein
VRRASDRHPSIKQDRALDGLVDPRRRPKRRRGPAPARGGDQPVYDASIRLLATRSAVAGAIRIPLR